MDSDAQRSVFPLRVRDQGDEVQFNEKWSYRSIQGMLTQFFIEHNIYNISFISSINKLKDFNLGKLSYKERKLKSIELTQNILNNNNFIHWINIFNNHKKKDDLSDSFLQGLWYINNIYIK